MTCDHLRASSIATVIGTAQTPELSRKNDRREGDPEASQNDVKT